MYGNRHHKQITRESLCCKELTTYTLVTTGTQKYVNFKSRTNLMEQNTDLLTHSLVPYRIMRIDFVNKKLQIKPNIRKLASCMQDYATILWCITTVDNNHAWGLLLSILIESPRNQSYFFWRNNPLSAADFCLLMWCVF